MSIELTTVTFALADQLGELSAGATVQYRLTHPDIDDETGIAIRPRPGKATADENGEGSFSTWPNERGRKASQYQVDVFVPGRAKPFWSFKITVPNAGPVPITQIISEDPFPPKSESQAALEEVHSAAAEVAEDRSMVEGLRQEVAQDKDAAEQAAGATINLVENLSVTYEAVPFGEPGSATWNADQLRIDFNIPAGAKGDTGAPGDRVIAERVVEGTSYTLQSDDAGAVIITTSDDPVTVTIPADTLPPRAVVTVIQGGEGRVSVEAASPVTINGPPNTQAQHAALSLYQRDTTGIWQVIGGAL